MKEEFLLLAKDYSPGTYIAGWYASEKLDGMRAFWDGGISRGILKNKVPYANTQRDDRYKEEPVSTGLWSRYGNVIYAPDDWLDKLPEGVQLDGELYAKNLPREQLMEIVKSHNPPKEWDTIPFNVFDMPDLATFCQPRHCYNNQYEFWVQPHSADWCADRGGKFRLSRAFEFNHKIMTKLVENSKVVNVVRQIKLAEQNSRAVNQAELFLEHIVSNGGEGIMLRSPSSRWMTMRSAVLLKMKQRKTAEAVVIGFEMGKNRHEGRLGSILIKFEDKELSLSGMSDIERELDTNGEPVKFPIGTTITFSYRGLTNKGIPTEAAYEHVRQPNTD